MQRISQNLLDLLNDIFLRLHCLVWVRWNFHRGYFSKKMFITTMTDNIIFNILGLISILIHILRLFASNIARWTSYNHNPHLIESKKCSLSYLLSWYNLHFAVWRTCIVYRLAMFIMHIIYLINIITSRATDKGTQPSSFNEHWLTN